MTLIKTLHVQLRSQWFKIRYPHSRSMRCVIESVVKGRDYPICLPADYQPKCIVDIGANVGATAIWFHSIYPDAKIYCYEPSPSVFTFLQENTNAIDAVTTVNIGLWNKDESKELHVGQHHPAQSSIVAHNETKEQVEQISLRRADDVLNQLEHSRISILKIDTEGCEVPILRCLNKNYWRRM